MMRNFAERGRGGVIDKVGIVLSSPFRLDAARALIRHTAEKSQRFIIAHVHNTTKKPEESKKKLMAGRGKIATQTITHAHPQTQHQNK